MSQTETETTVTERETETVTVRFPPTGLTEVSDVESQAGGNVEIEWTAGYSVICLNIFRDDTDEHLGVYLPANDLRDALQRVENPQTNALVLSQGIPENSGDPATAWAAFPIKTFGSDSTMFGLWIGEADDADEQFNADEGAIAIIDETALNGLVRSLTHIEATATAYALLKHHLITFPVR